MKQTEVLTHATHVNGWFPAVYMSCMSQKFRFISYRIYPFKSFGFFCSCIRCQCRQCWTRHRAANQFTGRSGGRRPAPVFGRGRTAGAVGNFTLSRITTGGRASDPRRQRCQKLSGCFGRLTNPDGSAGRPKLSAR